MSDTDNAYRAGAACAGEKYAGRIRELDTKLTEALAQVATLREKASALLEWCNDHFGNNGSDWSSTSAPGHECDELDAALADTDAAARAHDAAIRREAALPWQMAVHAEARDYHQEANMPDTCRPEQVKNIFEDAREDARRRALEDVLVCLAPLMARGPT